MAPFYIRLRGFNVDEPEQPQNFVIVNLDECSASTRQTDNELKKEYTVGLPVETTSQQISFFPLAVDDYFMSVAILSGKFSDVDKVRVIHSF